MLLKTTAIVSFINVLNTIVHFLFGISLAYFFGASAEMDAYVVASNFVITLNFLFVGAQTRSFIPFIAKYENEDIKNDIIASIVRFNAVVFLLVSGLLFLFSKHVSFLLAPGLSPDQVILTSNSLKILSLFILLSNLCGLGAGLLEFDLKFKKTAIISFVQAVFLIVVLFSTVKIFGIYSVALSHVVTLLGVTFFYSFMYIKNGHIIRCSLTLYNSYIKKYLFLLLPIILGSIFTWLIQYADTFIASFFKTGSISYISYCQKIIRYMSVISNSICVIYFPILSKLNKESDNELYLDNFYTGLNKLFTVIIFLATFIVLYKVPIIKFLFERGNFTSEDTLIVSSLLSYFILVIICSPLGTYFAGAYYSRQKTKTGAVYSIISSSTNIVFNFVLGYIYGIKGLAAASSIAYLVGNILQISNIGKAVDGYSIMKSIGIFQKSIFVSVIISLIVILVNKYGISYSTSYSFAQLAIYLSASFVIYMILFVALGYMVNVYLVREIVKSSLDRFKI